MPTSDGSALGLPERGAGRTSDAPPGFRPLGAKSGSKPVSLSSGEGTLPPPPLPPLLDALINSTRNGKGTDLAMSEILIVLVPCLYLDVLGFLAGVCKS